MKVLVSGSSGLIGTAVVAALRASGNGVARLVRRGAHARGTAIEWHPGHPLDADALYTYDAVIHLAGRTVAGRWTEAVREEILKSRVTGTRTISTAVAQSFRQVGKPKTLISVSAIGYYGSRGDEVLTEKSGAGQGFLAHVTEQWEASTWTAQQAGVRVVLPRLGLVLARQGGALARMLPIFQLGLGGKIGDGQQYWSWVTLDDTVRALDFLLRNTTQRGPINVVAPNPVTNGEFTRTLAKVLHRPAVFPLPATVARLAFDKMADELMLASQRVKPEALEKSGFKFKDVELEEALVRVLRKA
jgi:uncharacterized protein (TIGR01777 family)